ncbi:DUF2325 domain-containing protein [Clostridium sp. WILCCON 0269]|uniref:DUF2325 domain-containing protein n=1 Tax=Candidatus Clostridium eludens TaxID=3381663 RepID=A0ABW8SPT8_9CLOT
MNILIVGGDRLDNIKDNLDKYGINKVNHITGRKKGDKKIEIPKNTDLVLVLTDFVGHNMTKIIKKQSKKNHTLVMFSKRSWICIQANIKNILTD